MLQYGEFSQILMLYDVTDNAFITNVKEKYDKNYKKKKTSKTVLKL